MVDHVQGGRGAKTICVIGGGAAGLAVLKVISESHLYKAGLWTVVAYEAREDVGGVWYGAWIFRQTIDPQVTANVQAAFTPIVCRFVGDAIAVRFAESKPPTSGHGLL